MLDRLERERGERERERERCIPASLLTIKDTLPPTALAFVCMVQQQLLLGDQSLNPYRHSVEAAAKRERRSWKT